MQIMYMEVRAMKCGGYKSGRKVKKESLTRELESRRMSGDYVHDGRKSSK